MAKRKPVDQTGNGYPYFRAFGGDWLASTTRARLTPEQRGAFWDLIFYEWSLPDCMLPADPVVLASYSGLGNRWRKVGEPLMSIAFEKRAGKFFNPRLIKERKRVERLTVAARKAGLKSGRVRSKR